MKACHPMIDTHTMMSMPQAARIQPRLHAQNKNDADHAQAPQVCGLCRYWCKYCEGVGHCPLNDMYVTDEFTCRQFAPIYGLNG